MDSKIKKMPRLYIPDATPEDDYMLQDAQAHYVRHVMRLQTGDGIRVFNGLQGEWVSLVKEINKKNVILSFNHVLKEQTALPNILIFCAITKKEAFDLIVEKSAELGASAFYPIITDHTVVHKINHDRLTNIAIEASEQSERLDVMKVHQPDQLKNILKTWDKKNKLIFCIERENAPLLINVSDISEPVAILIGPEGGFSDAEKEFLLQQSFVIPASLGRQILRAETALILSLGMIALMLEK